MRLLAVLIAATLAAGCASQASRQHDAAQTAASWTAACQMTLGHWAQGDLTAPFTRKALERAGRDLSKTREDIAPYAVAAVDAAGEEIAAAIRDVDRQDRGAATMRARALGELATQLRHAAGEDQR